MGTTSTCTDRWIVMIHGELDISTGGHLAEVAGILAGLEKEVDFDLAGVTFIDPSGWDGVTAAVDYLNGHGVAARAVNPSGPVRRLQELLAPAAVSQAA